MIWGVSGMMGVGEPGYPWRVSQADAASVELAALPFEMVLTPRCPTAVAGTDLGQAVDDTLRVADQMPLARWCVASAGHITATPSGTLR